MRLDNVQIYMQQQITDVLFLILKYFVNLREYNLSLLRSGRLILILVISSLFIALPKYLNTVHFR